MSQDRTCHIRNLVAIFLEARACMMSAGVAVTNAEVIDLVRLVQLREAEIAPNGIYDQRARALAG